MVYFTKVVTKTDSTTMCLRILDIEIFLLPLTLTGNTKIVSVMGLFIVISVKLCPSIKRVIVK